MRIDISKKILPKVDGYLKVGTDSSCDLKFDFECYPWPLEDNSVHSVICFHSFQSIKNLDSFIKELYRVCSNKCNVKFVVPYYTSIRSTADPSHIRTCSEMTFSHLNKEFRELNGSDFYKDVDFNLSGIAYKWVDDGMHVWENKSEEAKAFAKEHYMNVIEDMAIEFIVKKEQN